MTQTERFNFKRSEPQPLFFLSHGGPTFADKRDKVGSNLGAWNKTKQIGNYIKNELKPDFIIVVSAHWQSDAPNSIEVSIPGPGEENYVKNDTRSNRIRPDENALIYDFYHFPQQFYESQFHTISNKALAEDIVHTIKESSFFDAKIQERGVDHGVFVPLKIAFADTDVQDSKTLDVDVPVIQVSLAGTPDIETHFKLGQVLSKYRDQNGLLILSGASVHNLKDLRTPKPNETYDYAQPFNDVLTDVLTTTDHSKILQEFQKIPDTPELNEIYVAAHPTNEHFLPAVIGAAASRGDNCKLLYTDLVASLGWNLYGWGLPEDSGL